MKKLLVLMLVLGLTSVANAAIFQISVGGSTDIMDSQINILPTEELVLDIWSSGYHDIALDGRYVALVVDTAYGTVTGGAPTTAAPSMSSMQGQDAYGDGFPGLNTGENGPYACIAGAYGEQKEAGVYFDSFVFTCVAQGDAIIRLVSTDGDFVVGTEADTLTVHQVPEPASMLLLGLGGLLLRRRK